MPHQLCDECRLLFAELFDAKKEEMRQAREREEVATVPFAERLQSMTGAEWEQMMEAQRSPKYTEASRKLQQHVLERHGGRFFHFS